MGLRARCGCRLHPRRAQCTGESGVGDGGWDGRDGALAVMKEGQQAMEKVEVLQVRTRCDDGAQDGAVVVPLLEPECNHVERERGQHRKRHAHVQRGLTEGKGLPHEQGLERRAGREDLRLHERTVERCPQVAWHIRRAGGLSLFSSLVLRFAMASTLVPGPSDSRDIARGAPHVPARVSPTARVR